MAAKQTKPAVDLREACVAEALRLIGQKGVESLSLREVARRLGVSHQAPYKHFPSRDHILAEVVRRAYVSFAGYLDRRPRTGDPWEDLCSMGLAYLEYAKKHRLHYRLMFETALPDPKEHPDMMRDARHAFSLLRDAISQIPGHEANADMEAMFVWSLHPWAGEFAALRRDQDLGNEPRATGRHGGVFHGQGGNCAQRGGNKEL